MGLAHHHALVQNCLRVTEVLLAALHHAMRAAVVAFVVACGRVRLLLSFSAAVVAVVVDLHE